MLLSAANELLRFRGPKRFVAVEQGGAGGAFARTLYLETPDVSCCVVNVPENSAEAAKWAVREAVAATGYSDRAIRRAIGSPEAIFRSRNGEPQVGVNSLQVSASHCSDLLIAVGCAGLVACDVEEITERRQDLWLDLLGAGGLRFG
jgi:hypothetical protein